MRVTYMILAIILIIYSLIMAKDFLYPLTFGILIAYLLYPIVNYLEKKGMPRILSILISVILTIILVGFLAALVFKRINLFLDEMPYFREKAVQHIDEVQNYLKDNFNISSGRLEDMLLSGLFNM